MKAMDNINRFWTNVNIQENDCWMWTASRSKNNKGYGNFRATSNGRRINGAHRFSYELHNNLEIPNGMIIRHTCDNPGCVRPDHLELGTIEDNVRDRVKRNRSAIGSKNASSIFTEQQVIDIRKKLINRQYGDIAKIAKEYQCSHAVICDINKNRIWKHI